MLVLKFVNAVVLGVWAWLFYCYVQNSTLDMLADVGVGILTFAIATFASEVLQELIVEKFNKT